MTRFAARLSPRLVDLVRREARKDVGAADVWRTVGAEAARRGLPRPSYERIRWLVAEERRLPRGPSTGEVLVDIAFRTRPPEALADHLSTVGVPRRTK